MRQFPPRKVSVTPLPGVLQNIYRQKPISTIHQWNCATTDRIDGYDAIRVYAASHHARILASLERLAAIETRLRSRRRSYHRVFDWGNKDFIKIYDFFDDFASECSRNGLLGRMKVEYRLKAKDGAKSILSRFVQGYKIDKMRKPCCAVLRTALLKDAQARRPHFSHKARVMLVDLVNRQAKISDLRLDWRRLNRPWRRSTSLASTRAFGVYGVFVGILGVGVVVDTEFERWQGISCGEWLALKARGLLESSQEDSWTERLADEGRGEEDGQYMTKDVL